MRSLIIFSFLIAVACAASLGHHNGTKVTAPTTTETSVKHVEQTSKTLHDKEHNSDNRASASVKLDKINEIEGIHKLEEAIEIEKENSNGAFHVGARTLEAFSKILNSEDVKEEGKKSTSDKTKKTEAVLGTSKTEATKTENGNTTKSSTEEKNEHKSPETSTHSGNHVHSRQTDTFFGSGSEIIQNGGLLGNNNGAFGLGNTGIVSSERLISTGGLINNGGIIRTGNLVNNGGLLRSDNLVYNQGITGSSGLANTGRLISSGGQLSGGGLIGSGQVLNTGRIIESGQPINAGSLINTGEVIGAGIQRPNNILVNNYGSNIVGNNGGVIRNSVEGANTLVVGLDALDSVPQTVEYSKQFFHFEAPEEHHEEGQITKQLSNVLKKNLQVVFINAPENTASTNAALQLAKQAIEQRTAIYVLSKEAEAAQLVGQLQQIQENVQTTPEVRIIKYRTPEDLERAKLDIQTQYEATGGSSESFNGGVAPLLNYASPGQNIRDIGTLLGPGLITSTNAGSGHYGQSSNIVSSVADSEQISGGQNVALGKQALLGSSVGQLNIIRSSNIGSSGLLGSGSSNVYNSKIGPSIQLGSGSSNVYNSNIGSSSQLGSGLNSGPSKFFTAGPLVGSNIGSAGSVGSTLLQNSKTITSSPIASVNLLGSNSGSSNILGTGTVVGSGIGSSGNALLLAPTIRTPSLVASGSQVGYSNSGSLKPVGSVPANSLGSGIGSSGNGLLLSPTIRTPSLVASGSQVGYSNSGSLKPVGSVPTNSFGINSVSGNTGYTTEFGRNSIVAPISGSSVQVQSNGASKTSGSSLSGGSPLLESYTLSKNEGFGSSSLQAANNKLASGSNLGLSSGSQTNVGGSQIGSSNGSLKVVSLVTGSPAASSTVAGSTLGSANNIQSSGSQSGFNSGSSKVVGGGSSNSGTSSLLGSSQGSLQLTGGNFASGSGSIVGSTTRSPKSFTTITPLRVVASNTGSSNVIANGPLLGSSSGSSATGSSSSFGSGVRSSNIGESGSLGKSKVGSYASDLTVGSSKLNGSGFSSGTGSANQFPTGKLAPETGSKLSSGSASSKISDNVSVLSSTGINRGQSGSSLSSSQQKTSGSGILLGSTVGSGGKYVSGLGIGSTIGEIVKVNN